MVKRMRDSLGQNPSDDSGGRTYTTKHGTTAKMNTEKIGRQKQGSNAAGKNGRRPIEEKVSAIRALAAEGYVAGMIWVRHGTGEEHEHG
ncbi:MAG: hypothetical protein SYC29_11635 [Planctomycetota bacterium]|nr:hypothetical protein [Planctomycetota bacterium]